MFTGRTHPSSSLRLSDAFWLAVTCCVAEAFQRARRRMQEARESLPQDLISTSVSTVHQTQEPWLTTSTASSLGALSIFSLIQTSLVQEESKGQCLQAFWIPSFAAFSGWGQESASHLDPESLCFRRYLWKAPCFFKAFCYQALTVQPIVHISDEQTKMGHGTCETFNTFSSIE